MSKITTQPPEKPSNLTVDSAAFPPTSRLEGLRRLTRVLDEAIAIPGTQRRIGLDALLGLIPGIGDMIGGLLASYAFLIAVQIGAPPTVLLRMLLNIGVDTITGAVPVIGDLFDFAWKANSRNLMLLERYLENPTGTRAASRRTLVLIVLGVVALCGGAVWLALAILKVLFG